MAKTATAAYTPVVDALREQIHTGQLPPGAWLPSESGLMADHGVSRYSAREALKRLAAEGLITVVDGKGSHVRERATRPSRTDTRALYTAPALTNSGKPSNAKNATPRVLDAEYTAAPTVEPTATGWVQANVDLALTLGVPEHTPVFTADRHYTTADGGPVHYRLHIPATTATRIPTLADNPDRTPDDLYATLGKAAPAGEPLRWTETVRATVATTEDTTTLHTQPGAVILITRRNTLAHDGTVLTMEETRRDATRTQLSYSLIPTEAPTAPVAGLATGRT